MLNKRVAVIGAGLAGLAAINKLARDTDYSLTLIEKSNSSGGRASTIYKDGFNLNQGAHALYNAGAANAYLKELGIVPAGAAGPVGYAWYEKKLYSMPVDVKSLTTTNLFDPIEKIQFASFINELPGINVEPLASVTYSDWLAARFSSPRIIAYLEALNRLGTYSNATELISAKASLKQLRNAQAGVKYVDGGWQTIVDAMLAAVPRPIDTRFGVNVTGVSYNKSEEKVVVTAGGAQEAFDFVILALPPKVVHAITGGLLEKNAMEQLVESRIACLDVCLRKLPEPKNLFALGLDESLYFSVHSSSAKLAPADGALIHLGYYLRPGEIGNASHNEKLLSFLDRLQPVWEEQLVYKRFLPNMVASFSTATASLRGANGPISPKFSSNERILACGDWIGEGHLLADASVASGLAAASIVGASKGKATYFTSSNLCAAK